MNVTTRFTEAIVSLVKSYCDNSDKTAAPEGSGSFAEYAMISLHRLRVLLRRDLRDDYRPLRSDSANFGDYQA